MGMLSLYSIDPEYCLGGNLIIHVKMNNDSSLVQSRFIKLQRFCHYILVERLFYGIEDIYAGR